MLNNVKVVAIIAAGGTGSRLGQEGGKQLLEVAGKPVAAWATEAVCAIECVDEVIVVCDPDRVEEYAQRILAHLVCDTPLIFVGGADTRAESVFCGLQACSARSDDVPTSDIRSCDETIVLIHDGARPLASTAMMAEMLAHFIDDPTIEGLVVGHPVSDTLKRVIDTSVVDTLDRTQHWAVQTPQIFRLSVLLDSYAHARERGRAVTDDASLVEAAGHRVAVYEGPRDNIKVTSAEDVVFVEAALNARC